MIEAEFSTASFSDLGGISCIPCGRKLWFGKNNTVLQFVFDGRQLVMDAATLEVFHDCRHPTEFYCPDCEAVTEPLLRGGKPNRFFTVAESLRCPTCYCDLIKRRAVQPARFVITC